LPLYLLLHYLEKYNHIHFFTETAVHAVISLLLQSRKFWWYLILSSSMLLHDVIMTSYWRHSVFTYLQCLLIYFNLCKTMGSSDEDKILIKHLHDSKRYGAKKTNEFP